MTITKALKKLYKKITGSECKGITKADVIEELAKNFPGAELPAVTAEDAGKVLKVGVNGWDKGNETVELPAYTVADAGKVLAVKADGTGVEWKALS